MPFAPRSRRPEAVAQRQSRRSHAVATGDVTEPPPAAGASAPDPAGSTKATPEAAEQSRAARWDLFTKPPRMIMFLLLWEAAAVAALAAEVTTVRGVTEQDWARLVALAVCATVHIQLTRRQEERRRSRIIAVHIDLSGIWIFPAALLLPIQLTLLLIAIVRVQRWINSRRPPYKFLFTSLTHAASALLAHRLYELLIGEGLVAPQSTDSLRTFGLLILVGFAYAALQAAAIGILLALGGTTTPTLKNVLGSKTDNLLDAATVGLGIVTTILLIHVPPAIVVLVLVSVVGNRLAEISQLQEEALTDAKTGIRNMRGWSESANRVFERASRSAQSTALLMVDLDHFKWINDTYGHPTGDDALSAVGSTLADATRPSDIVGRYGGEEFVVLLPDTDSDAASLAAERIRMSIADLRIASTGRHGNKIMITDRTTSIGVAVYPEHGSTLEELLHAADAAVYQAKEHGRNQVRFAEPAVRRQSDAQPPDARGTDH